MSGYKGPMIDVDVHHTPKSDAELIQYLPKQWREYLNEGGRDPLTMVPIFSSMGLLQEGLTRRRDSYPPEGGPPGSSYPTMKEQLLDRFDYTRALLTFDVGDYAVHSNPYFARAVCSILGPDAVNKKD